MMNYEKFISVLSENPIAAKKFLKEIDKKSPDYFFCKGLLAEVTSKGTYLSYYKKAIESYTHLKSVLFKKGDQLIKNFNTTGIDCYKEGFYLNNPIIFCYVRLTLHSLEDYNFNSAINYIDMAIQLEHKAVESSVLKKLKKDILTKIGKS